MGGQGSEDMIVHASSPTQLPSSQPLSARIEATPVPATPVPATPTRSTQHVSQSSSLPDPGPSTSPPIIQPHHPSLNASKNPPKKIMQLKAGGRLVSPVKSLPETEEKKTKKPAKRGRKKKERLIICHYSTKAGLGDRVQRILSGQERHHLPSPVTQPPSLPAPPKPAKPAVNKPTHPFFSSKPKPPLEPPGAIVNLPPSPRRPSAVTPGKLRAQRQLQRIQDGELTPVPPTFGGNRDRDISKQPGMTRAPWPSKESAHVRGKFYYHAEHRPGRSKYDQAAPVIAAMSRKMKRSIPLIDPAEDLLAHYSRRLDFQQEDSTRPDGFQNPPLSLRLPTRSLISGSQIQNFVYKQVREASSLHPACVAIFDSIPQALTPYDEGRSEIQAWPQKYAPMSAEQVLQPGKEAFILRDWMESLTIMAVEGSNPLTAKAKKLDNSYRDREPKKKRREKTKDLDDFVVNSDEEELDDLDILPEPEDNVPCRDGKTKKPSVVQRGNTKLSNVTVISGPPGCGKSAMVYAVAKELGFEIFEINSGSRRTGKDVLDRVGDMVENHLVQRHSAETGNTSADEDAGRLSEAFKADLASGRQGTMGSFFKAKPKSSHQIKKQGAKQTNAPTQKVQQSMVKSKTSRSQKQSLILLEEVDVLFEEDKGFWQTVLTLVINSKRPVIMTCNDEDDVPLQAMTLHAVLRLSPPPANIATDYLLLLAAKEGHLLDRTSVSTLYETKKQDFRASIAHLQLWCQMGVGDPRGGLGWIFQRWPAGTGIDENGQPIRVTSEGTYQIGMGNITHEPEPSLENSGEEELLLQLWEDWGDDPRDQLFAGNEDDAEVSPAFSDRHSRMKALKDHERLSMTMSDMDAFGRIGLPGNTNYDITEPDMSDKYRSNFIIGMPVLQTPDLLDHSSMDTRLTLACSSLASKIHHIPLDISTPALLHKMTSEDPHTLITRAAFSQALDALADQPVTTNYFNYTSMDGPFKTIAVEVAPYVRSIAAYDLALEPQRARLGGEEGLATSKKMRTTRAARSALEGGQRSLTRRERWFTDIDLDLGMVLETGGEGWPRFGSESAPSVDATTEAMDMGE
ncbi:hypothetical protein BDV97DRAFT_359274 [Delphinella strobiligena]|nr:hypothetical protein BDV97DRAFT_359274 [Delphinella strobiligena]